jgi:ribosomal protein S18 acetylase RimI-like enzyme
MDVRDPLPPEVEALAQLWLAGWRDAHLEIVPPELEKHRNIDNLRQRMTDGLANVRVIGPPGDPLGFYMLKADELYQLYVSARARGTGAATALMTDAEARLASLGLETAWLACAVGNNRAARFYEKSGWHRVRTETSWLQNSEGQIPVEIWRYEKRVGDRR